MTDLELMRLMSRHCLVWVDLPDKMFCFVFNDKYEQIDIDPAHAQRFQNEGLLKPLPPLNEGGPTVQYRLTPKAWQTLLDYERADFAKAQQTGAKRD